MQRTVISPADLSGQALTDLKDWLGISRPTEDNLLTDLLEASLAMCEAFIGQAPIEQVIEETVPPSGANIPVSSRPVKSLNVVEAVTDGAARTVIDTADYNFAIDAQGNGCLQLSNIPDAQRLILTISAGIAADWSTVPRPLKQGMIRLAAFNYRDRESGRSANPPASVAALWRPWRILRVA